MIRFGLDLWFARLLAAWGVSCLILIGGGLADEDLRLQPASDNHVAIPRAAMGKDFLLSASLIPQSGAATSSGLGGRIVRFELFPDGVDLYESTVGQVVTDDLPARRLLTTFPIVAQDGNLVTIDFNKGMNRVFTEGWYGRGNFRAEASARTLEVPRSRVFEVRQAENRLLIRQTAQVRDRERSTNEEARYEVRYYLSPYEKSEFEPKENLTRDQRYVRYFEAQPNLELNSGRSTSPIARFSIEDPVVFYYSSNTPEEYEQAVKDGILYWNRAFGKEVLKAEKAPDGVTAPSPDHNIIQWVPWDSAGFAYADALLDPRTGQTLHGQAYLTSVFAVSGKQRARVILRTLEEMTKEGDKKENGEEGDKEGDNGEGDSSFAVAHHAGPLQRDQGLGIRFLQPACSCNLNQHLFARQLMDGLHALLAEGEVGDDRVLAASQDYVRNVTAHEVGHVIGLRHNFAGSLEGNITPAELDKWFSAYLTEKELPEMQGKFATNSVMEYSAYTAAVYSGWIIGSTEEVLPHDKAAIQWGYFGSDEPKEKKMLFGTDDDVGRFGDLRTFDFGAEPVVSAFSSIGKEIQTLPNNLIEIFISNKAPMDPRDAIPLEEVALNPTSRVLQLTSEYDEIFRWFRASTRSLRLERDFSFSSDLNRDERLKVLWDDLNEQVKKLGGIDRVAFSFVPVSLSLDLKEQPKDVVAPEKLDTEKLVKKLGELLDAPGYKEFVGADGETHSFTDEEKELIKERGKAYFEAYERELVKRICQSLGRATRDLGVEANKGVSDDDIVAKLEKQIIALAKAVIMARDDSKVRRGKIASKATVEIIDFKYDLETRLAAAQMLNDSIGSFRAWSKEARSSLHDELKKAVDDAVLASDISSFNDNKLSRTLREWYLDQQRVLQLLPKAPGS